MSNEQFLSDDQYFVQLFKEKQFAENFVLRDFRVNRQEAEDTFGQLCLEHMLYPERRFKEIRRGPLCKKLRWIALNRKNRRRAAIRGSGAEHIPIEIADELSLCGTQDEWCDFLTEDQRKFRELQLRTIESKCDALENIVRMLLLRQLETDPCDYSHLLDLFKDSEELAFMRPNGGTATYTRLAVRKKVNRIRDKVEAKVEKALGRSRSGGWLN